MPDAIVLIIEDDDAMLRFLRNALQGQSFRLVEASTGKEGLSKAASVTPDLVLLDVGLPDMDGYDLVEYVRRNTTTGVIVITSRDDITDRVKGYTTGADLYLTKPVNTRELAAAIASIAARRSAATTGEAPLNVERWRLNRDDWRLTAPD